jgi:glycosyltransferase involved in cell wall biosynthesis
VISVVVPCFNEPADRLSRTLLSVIESIDASRGDEIIVVNDGGAPPDVWDLPVRLFELTVNRGPAGALNFGYSAATGRFIARLDVGDVFYPEVKARQFASVIAGDVAASFSHALDENMRTVWPLALNWSRRIYRDGQFPASTTVVRRDAWERVSFDETLRHCDDWNWTLRVQHEIGWILFDDVTGTATVLPGGYSDRSAKNEQGLARKRTWKLGQRLRAQRRAT